MIILDTNVVSDLMSRRSPPVMRWLSSVPAPDLHTTAITKAEILYGIARLPKGRKRADLQARADAAFAQMVERILPFDSAAADAFAGLQAERERIGRPISAFDAQIASIAVVRRAHLATRNVRDFDDCGLTVINPFGA